MALRSTRKGRFNIYENLGEVTKGELEQLRAETRRLAKVANQRLVRMEKESRFGTSPAYKRAREDLREDFGAPRRRYRENLVTADRAELIREYKSLRDFITSKTSTVAGYNEVIEGRYERFKDETGSDISIEDYVEAWEKIEADKNMKSQYYRSQFQLIKEAAASWNAAKEEGREDETSFAEILGGKIEEWNGKRFIESLRK